MDAYRDVAAVKDDGDAPLIGTLRFVFVMGLAFLAGWIGLYLLLRGRW